MGNGWKECGCLVLKKPNLRYLNSVQTSIDCSDLRLQDGDGESLSLEVTETSPKQWCVFPWLGWGQTAIQETPGTTVQDSVA